VDRNLDLLFGVLALQADLLTSAQFIEACSACTARKETSLADLVVKRGWLTSADKADVQRLVERKLKKHAGSIQDSLAEAAGPVLQQSSFEAAGEDVRAALITLFHGPPANAAASPVPDATAQASEGQPSTIAYQPEKRNRYALTRLLAKGGIGQVWLAHDEDLGREVALKELRPEQASNPAAAARFVEEARIAAQLQHPGIIPVHELSLASGTQTSFYTMKFVRGRTLADACKLYHERREAGTASTLELRELLGAFITVCQAVAYAHSRNVIHRDLKPSNVALGEYGEVLVLDFGLSKVVSDGTARDNVDGRISTSTDEQAQKLLPVSLPQDDSREKTLQGQVLGTPSYMSPEQAQGNLHQVDQRSDIYGLGAILYEILTGQPPFFGPDSLSILKQVLHHRPEPPRVRVSSIPAPLEAICLKALAKQKSERNNSATELATEVQRFLADEPVQAYPEPWTTRARRWLDRHRIPMSVAAAALHGVIWLTMFGWIAFDLPLVQTSFAKLPIKLPMWTEMLMRISRPAIDHPLLALLCLAVFLVVDCWLHWRLSHSSGSRVIREIWSGLVVLLPVVFLCLTTLATTLPYVKLVEALSQTFSAMDQAVLDESKRLEGSWKLTSGERAGGTLSEKALGEVRLSFTNNQFTWGTNNGSGRGVYSLYVYRRPKELGLIWSDGELMGKYQSGIYALNGNRLEICLAPPGAMDKDLPINFSTKENKCTVYKFERVNALATK
jgi:uncharacterized protein (TIGR03067 family)